jgi:imidazole glycerol-phosphate synthase subunit HisH
VTAEVVIVDSGGANLASLQHALARLGAATQVSDDPTTIADAARVLVPGVGSAQNAMQRLRDRKLDTLLPRLRQPVLGICLGMQLLFDRSDEGDTTCLGIVPGRVQRLAPGANLPVPHMGWNSLQLRRADPLLAGIDADDWFYFVHSYAVTPGAHTLASALYGVEVAAVVRRDNFWGTQFHPERSSVAGARLLANFLSLRPGEP